ncbi:MAG TPA: transcriptional regulator [Microbacterium sp.]|nr:transcriptional regulator [Microbacterium sp.]
MSERAAGPRAEHPRTRLDDNFATPIRFSLMAALGEGIELDFATLADILQANDPALSKAISHLQDAGYVVGRKAYVGTRPRTWVRSTAAGLSAFSGHLRALREIVELGGQQMP